MDHNPIPKDLQLAGLIHDLNNVFQTVLEAADLLSTDPKWAGLSNTIMRSIERGKGITGSLDDSTRSVEFEEILDRAIQFTEDVRASAPSVTFERDVAPGLRFRGRVLALERVLVNLLVNAARAATAAGTPGEIHIQALNDRDEICIVVCDSGPGIEARILPLIFEPGFSTRSDSSGLGLHIVRTIVAEHGGTVTAANREGRPGACFTLRIPNNGAALESSHRNPPSELLQTSELLQSSELLQTGEPLPSRDRQGAVAANTAKPAVAALPPAGLKS
jgi:signal transduction histidine kinase